MVRIRNGERLETRVAEGVLGERLKRGIIARPKDKDTARIGDWFGRIGQAAGDNLLWEDIVGCKEDVRGIAREELGCE